MSIFSRRILQRLINENSSFLSVDQTLRHVSSLNHFSQDTLACEWEAAIVNAFGRLGTIRFEPNLGGTSRPDLHFQPFGASEPIVLEISTVSDKALHQKNPFDQLSETLRARIRKLRERGVRGGFRLEVGTRSRQIFPGDPPTRLRLPTQHRFVEVVFNQNFRKFLAKVSAQPNTQHSYSVKNNEADVTISYDPRSKGLMGQYASYTTGLSKQKNPVASALERKVDQLKASGFPGPFAIVLCDGGCDLFRHGDSDWGHYGHNEVIREFFRKHQSVSVVILLRVQVGRSNGLIREMPRIESCLHTNALAKTVGATLMNCFAKLESVMPRPAKIVSGARHFIEWSQKTDRWNEGDSLYGGLSVSHNTIRISARTVLDLLAGRLDQQAFANAHDFSRLNPFQKKIEQGRLIIKVSLEKSEKPEDDDEWLVFEFGEPDPAISPFKSPAQD